jgi:hypothetical protein
MSAAKADAIKATTPVVANRSVRTAFIDDPLLKNGQKTRQNLLLRSIKVCNLRATLAFKITRLLMALALTSRSPIDAAALMG